MTKKKFMKRLMSWPGFNRNRANEFVNYIAHLKQWDTFIKWDDKTLATCISFQWREPNTPVFVMCLNLNDYE